MLISFFSFEIYVSVGERDRQKREQVSGVYDYAHTQIEDERREKEGTEGGRKWQREKVRQNQEKESESERVRN